MLNRDSSENGIKINRFNKQKKNKFARVAPFFSNQQKKKIKRAARFLVFPCRGFARLHYCYGEIVVCANQRFCFLCSCSLLFFRWPLLAGSRISHFLTAAMKFSCFSSNEIPLLCFQSLALALSLLST